METRSLVLTRIFEPIVSELSKTELKIHEYVMENPEQVIYSTMNQLAELIEVGEATVLRYVRKLGYDGYSTFKLELFKSFDAAKEISNEPYIEQITQNMINTISETKLRVSEEAVNKASEMINKSDVVLIIGKGTSNITSQDTFSRLIRIGINAIVIDDSHLFYMYSSILNKNATVICYSFSGETYEIVKAATLAKEHGAKIIGITNYQRSKIAELSDITLFTSGYEQNISGGFLSSKISQIYISDILITRCAINQEVKTKEYMEKTTQSVFE